VSPLFRLACILLACAFLPLAPLAQGDPPATSATYTAGATGVVRSNEQTVLDEGGVVCTDTGGIGGACIRTPSGFSPGVLVADAVSGRDVAFQVCADNNGDGICTPGGTGFCADSVTFSHDDNVPTTYNPVNAPAINLGPQCRYPGFLVVFLCQGVDQAPNDDGGQPHVEGPATTGSITQAPGTGSGNFCSGSSGGTGGNSTGTSKPYLYEDR
jgi:hypothetical protein